ncbi:MAG TPA: glycoside hydrolase family 3 N-terminal domain-containing protein [Streptosporangiaceae bacterium]
MTTSRIFLAGLIAVSTVATGCDSTSSQAAASTPPPTPAAATSAAATPTSETAAPTPTASCATTVFDRMTEAERVGQLFLVGIPVDGGPGSEATRAIRDHHFGSVLFSGNSTAGVKAIKAMASQVQDLTGATAGVKFFVAANQEGGEIQELKGPGFAAMPTALSQGSLSPQALRSDAEKWGRELKEAGVNLNLAPVMDVVPPGTAAENAPVGALDREFGDNPATNGVHGAAFIKGMREAGVVTTAKHFPGLGRVRGNTDFTANVVDDQTTADDPYLKSFQDAIGAGVPFVMVALATYTRIDPGHLAVFSSRIIQGILRGHLHFTGVIMSDDLGEAAAVAKLAPGTRAIDFLQAGGDMITSQTVPSADTMAEAVLARAKTDAAFRKLVSTAVMRILGAKESAGLLPCLPGVQ